MDVICKEAHVTHELNVDTYWHHDGCKFPIPVDEPISITLRQLQQIVNKAFNEGADSDRDMPVLWLRIMRDVLGVW